MYANSEAKKKKPVTLIFELENATPLSCHTRSALCLWQSLYHSSPFSSLFLFLFSFVLKEEVLCFRPWKNCYVFLIAGTAPEYSSPFSKQVLDHTVSELRCFLSIL